MRGLNGYRAVIFDLWETLIDWDREAATALGRRGGRARRRRLRRALEPVDDAVQRADPGRARRGRCAGRAARPDLCPAPAASPSLARAAPGRGRDAAPLRADGYLVGLITVCSEDIETLWPESEFAGLFDAEVFSSRVGLSKPDPRIYLHCCELLGVEPQEAVFVGDGANDELAGARRVGMDAILIHREGEPPLWPGLEDWDGPRVTSIPGVLDLLA